MIPDRSQRIKELFQAALERELSQRAVFLDQACAGDASLRREVEALLAAHQPAVSSGDQRTTLAGTELFTDGQVASIERRIGPYRLIRELGQGGMGSVYLAARADEQYRKRVAIKLVKPGMGSESILRRFRNERQILAGLDHPNIAKLLDGGATDDGMPYFVMEYVEGEPIDKYCDRHTLPTEARLKLFRSVCSAVHYAHQNLVVHRDLKPPNILITADGVPKLLDFGIAKLLNPELSFQTIDPTAIDMRLMTPQFASPEQVRGETITTASDVYSLGVLLYELLTGHRPYNFKKYLAQEIERVICEVEPEKPSTAISQQVEMPGPDGTSRIRLTPESVSKTREGQPEKLRRRLEGDLDTIVLMAMRKDPGRRYTSVEQLSADIGRHLDHLPVIARRETLGYRAGKFIRRHRIGMAAAATIVVLVLAFIIAMLIQSAQIARALERAEQEAAKAKAVNEFLQQTLGSADPQEGLGREVTVLRALASAVAKIPGSFGDQPEIDAAVRNTIGLTYLHLGRYDEAEPLLRAALEIRRRVLGDEHADVAQSLNNLASLLHDKGDYQAAEPLYRETLAMRRKLLGDEHPEVAVSLNNLAALLHDKGDLAAAEPLYREALARERRLLGDEHPKVATGLDNLARLLLDKGDYEAAEPLFRQALAQRRKLLRREHPEVAVSLNNLAGLLFARGDYEAAEPLYREALALQRKLLGREHPMVSTSLNNLATVLHLKGDYAAAESLYREALALDRKVLGDKHAYVANDLNNLGRLLQDKGDYTGAEPIYKQALDIFRKTLDSDHWLLALSRGNYGACLTKLGRYNEAEKHLLAAHTGLQASLGQQHERTQKVVRRLIELYNAGGKPDEASKYRAMLRAKESASAPAETTKKP